MKPLLKYQQELLADQSRFIIIEKSRRVGVTWILAAKALDKRISIKQDLWVTSSDFDNAKEFIRYCIEWADVFNTIIGEEYIDLTIATKDTLTLPNGSRIGALTSEPKNFRGKSGDVILDEFAFHEQAEAMLAAAIPVTTWSKGCITICSTHNGPATVFRNLCKDAELKKNQYNHYKIDLPRALEDGFALKIEGDHHKLLPDVKACNQAFYDFLKSGCVNEDMFKQEFLAQPLSVSALITAEEYDKLSNLFPSSDTLDPKHKYNPLFVGIDVGRVHDLTVVWVLEQFVNNNPKGPWDQYDYKTVCVKVIKNQPIPTQHEMIKPLLMHECMSGGTIDMGTVGRALSDSICQDFTFVTPISFSAPIKTKLAERVKGYIAHEKVSLPDDPATREDILSLRREIGKSGNISYEGGTKESHCDRFWSLSLALEAAELGAGAIFL